MASNINSYLRKFSISSDIYVQYNTLYVKNSQFQTTYQKFRKTDTSVKNDV